MCGRYERHATPPELIAHFGVLLADTAPLASLPISYNVAPGTLQPVIRYGKTEGANVCELVTWGFRPMWAKRAWINARAETLFTTTAFREFAAKRRCLVIATGWYEWQDTGGKRKQPYYIRLGHVFAFAGVWTARKLDDERWEKSFAIVTAPAGPLLERVHDRMPLVIHPRQYAAWLDTQTESPAELMKALDNGEVEAYPVSTAVNDPKRDDASCVKRADPA